MTTSVVTESIADTLPSAKARLAGVSFLLSILTGVFAQFFAHDKFGFTADLITAASYIAVTALFYDLFKSVSKSLSLLAAFFNLVVLTLGELKWHPFGLDVGLVFFGLYSLLIGYLIFRLSLESWVR